MLGDRKEKEGVLAPTKLDRELEKIEWNVRTREEEGSSPR